MSDVVDADVESFSLAPKTGAHEPLPFNPMLLRAVADLVLTTTFDGVWLIDANNRTTLVNHRMASMLGYSIDEMLGATIFEFMEADARQIAKQNLARRQSGVSEQHEFLCRRKDGSTVWLLVTANPVYDEAGNYAGSLALIADLSVQKERESALLATSARLEQELADLSAAHEALLTLVSHDPLTGLYNRRYLEDRLTQEVGRCRRYERNVTLLYLDLDSFKGINDRLGHAGGDEVLCHIAQLLQKPVNGPALLRSSDLAARIGGDEIVIVATESDTKAGHTLARRILDALQSAPPFVRGTRVDVSGSIGIASCPEHAFTAAELLTAADEAMYRAKKLGGGRVCLAERT